MRRSWDQIPPESKVFLGTSCVNSLTSSVQGQWLEGNSGGRRLNLQQLLKLFPGIPLITVFSRLNAGPRINAGFK